MKKHIARIAVATLTTLGAGIARADDGDRPLTREEVVASVMAARQSGELAVLNAGGSWTPPTAQAKQRSRDDVVAEVMAARQSGELATLNAGGAWSAPSKAAPLTRDQVVHDYMASHQAPSDAAALERSL